MLKFSCYSCDKKYGVPDELAGKKMKCKKCGTLNLIPHPPKREFLLGNDGDSLPSVLDLDIDSTPKEKVVDGLVGLPVDIPTDFTFKCERCSYDIPAKMGQSGYIDCPKCGRSQLVPLRQLQSAKRLARAAAATGTQAGSSTKTKTHIAEKTKAGARVKKKLATTEDRIKIDRKAESKSGSSSGHPDASAAKTKAQIRAAAKAKARARAKAKARGQKP